MQTIRLTLRTETMRSWSFDWEILCKLRIVRNKWCTYGGFKWDKCVLYPLQFYRNDAAILPWRVHGQHFSLIGVIAVCIVWHSVSLTHLLKFTICKGWKFEYEYSGIIGIVVSAMGEWGSLVDVRKQVNRRVWWVVQYLNLINCT